ncbi:MAG: hypothetical protein ACI9SC_000373 [Gammaproteobacteria bacterium]|jgi:hypothetical protein
MSSTASRYPTIVSGFGYSPLSTAVWRDDPACELEYRDLSLNAASKDALHSRHVRAKRATSSRTFGSPVSGFSFVFVLKGKVILKQTSAEPIELGKWDTASCYGVDEAEWQFEEGAEALDIVLGEPGKDQLQPPASNETGWVVTRESAENYLLGEGPRSYFKYRDLGVAGLTNRRIHIHIVAATKAMEYGTGWHSHNMGQIFYVLNEWADLAVEDRPWVKMSAGDAMCIHPRLAHNVPGFSAEYVVLEMCVPADYDTIDAKAG